MPYPGGGFPADREAASLVAASFSVVVDLRGAPRRGAMTAWSGPEILYGNWDTTATTIKAALTSRRMLNGR